MVHGSVPPASTVTAQAGVLAAIAHRWPTWLGLAITGVSFAELDDGRSQAAVVFLAALLYLATAILAKPGAAWIMWAASVVAMIGLEQLDINPWPAYVASAVTLLVLAVAGGLLRRRRLTAAQAPAMLVFGAAAVAAVSLSPALGGYLVAAALIGHATLDVILWRANRVVTRSLTEFCAVLDFTLGIGIIAMQLLA
ncbi:hypothetical protein [Nonomuraea sp. LPB2021202275-12-8]|uniref:hypothetical protein n=1 Tax=Nonomuraea sp. LPB2021202275-12-8 TaxID=3120159 RepID=UPI00300D9CA7